MNIVIADDTAIVRERLAGLLEELPFVRAIHQAETTADAERLIRETHPDVAILDIRFQNGTGIDVLQALKGSCPGTTFIMLTGFPFPQYRNKCFEAGADYFLEKSTEFNKLPRILEEIAGEMASHQPAATE